MIALGSKNIKHCSSSISQKKKKYKSEGFYFSFFFTWVKNDKILNLLSLAEFQTGKKGKKT